MYLFADKHQIMAVEYLMFCDGLKLLKATITDINQANNSNQ